MPLIAIGFEVSDTDAMAMAVGEQDGEGPDLFAHQLRALLARLRQEELDLVGASFRSVKVRMPKGDPHVASSSIPFHLPSPLTGRDRQNWGFRIPHIDIKPQVPRYAPLSKTQTPHPDYPARDRDTGGHVDYVLDGAVVRHDTHLDYLWRGL